MHRQMRRRHLCAENYNTGAVSHSSADKGIHESLEEKCQ